MGHETTEFEIRDFFFDALSTYGLKYGQKELSLSGLRIDIFAIDNKHSPYIIEFKKDKDRHIVGQAATYLSLVPTYDKEIEKKINFFDIRWENLKVICIASSFLDRDYKAAEYDPLKGRIHFYCFSIIKTGRSKIFSLNLMYKGPDEKGPLLLPEKIIDEYNIKQVAEEFGSIEKKEARREYYSQKILPLLEDIGNNAKFFEDAGLYQHNSYWGNWFAVRFGTDKKKAHKASIEIAFSKYVSYGFDLTHSLEEAQILQKNLCDENNRKIFTGNTLRLKNYFIWIPNSGIKSFLPIEEITEKGLNLLLKSYEPKIPKDCYLQIKRRYKNASINIKQAVNILKEEYKIFEYIFKLCR
jgi:hypothetical protein